MESTPNFIDTLGVGERGKVRAILADGPAILTENGKAVAIMVSLEAYERMMTTLKNLQDELTGDLEASISIRDKLAALRVGRNTLVTFQVDQFLRDFMRDDERRVLELRFGLKDGKQRTQAEVGREMGLSASSISRIEKHTFSKLRRSGRTSLLPDLRDHLIGISTERPFSPNPDINPHYAALLDRMFFPEP
jgi:PHD/YefM family antitoxin component YafN of YafNO toxin-antitoxin module